jgi:predicted ATPase
LTILATSRSPLGIAGEVTFPVPPLGIFDIHRRTTSGPPIRARDLAGFDAVKLFVERAAAVRPDFVLTDEIAPAVAEICARLDGIPLAIELAAARLRLLDAGQIATRLEDRFRLLRGGGQDRLPHQQTLQALIDWSHDLLTNPEKILLRRMAVFVGGRSLEAIEAVCAGNDLDEQDVLDLLQGLVEKSLVHVETGESGARRYTLLESVWEYAGRHLASAGETQELRERHAAYFLEWARRAAPAFEGPDQARWLAAFDDDRFNLRAAMRYCIEHGRAGEGVEFLAALGRPIEVRGHFTEGRELARLILAMPGPASPCQLSQAHSAAGRFAWAMDLSEDARHHFSEAERLATTANDPVCAGLSRAYVGFLERSEGNTVVAEGIFRESLERGRALGHAKLEALALGGLARVAMTNGKLEEARELSQASLAIHRKLGDRWIVGLVLWGLGRIALLDGDIGRAEEALREWMEITRDLGNGWILPYILQASASIQIARSRHSLAARLLGASEALRERYGFRLSVTERQELEDDLDALRAVLSSGQLAELWREGRDTPATELLYPPVESTPGGSGPGSTETRAPTPTVS